MRISSTIALLLVPMAISSSQDITHQTRWNDAIAELENINESLNQIITILESQSAQNMIKADKEGVLKGKVIK